MKAKKSLGQNFLNSHNVVRSIVETADLSDSDVVLEVGPGKGVLTEKLLGKAGKVIAIEKDNRLIEFLEDKFKSEIKSKKLELINADILTHKLDIKNYKLVANIPYYITGELLQKFLSSNNQPSKMVLLVQKEVADRIIARDKKESILSVSVKAYGKPKYIKKVGSENFSPKPKVDSAILLIDDISKDFFTQLGGSTSKLGNSSTWEPNSQVEERFFELVKTGFAHKRKLLISNLKSFVGQSGQETLEKAFEKCDINKKARAENLTLASWKCVTNLLN